MWQTRSSWHTQNFNSGKPYPLHNSTFFAISLYSCIVQKKYIYTSLKLLWTFSICTFCIFKCLYKSRFWWPYNILEQGYSMLVWNSNLGSSSPPPLAVCFLFYSDSIDCYNFLPQEQWKDCSIKFGKYKGFFPKMPAGLIFSYCCFYFMQDLGKLADGERLLVNFTYILPRILSLG